MVQKIILLVVLFYGIIFAGGGDSLICATAQYNNSTGTGGKYITAYGHIHALAIFAQFPDDTTWNANSEFWPSNQPPRVLNTFFDKDYEFPSGRHNVSNYFYEMSKTATPDQRLKITGEGIYIKLDHSRKWYADRNKTISDINKDILLKVDQMDPDMVRFDNWTFGNGQQNHHHASDGKIDLIYLIYRNIYQDSSNYKNKFVIEHDGTKNWSGYAGIDLPDDLFLSNNGLYVIKGSCYNNSSGITIVKFRFYFDDPDPYVSSGGNGRYLHLFLHELGHYFGLPHQYNSGVAALMGLNENAGYTMSPYERERVGWISPTTITNDTQILLNDYVNSGDVIKINQGSNKYIYITNHQLQNAFDLPNGNYEAPGIYITKSYSGSIHQISAKGNFDWQYMGLFDNPWGNPGDKIPAWDWIVENPTGKGYLDALNYPDNNKPKVQHIYYNDNHQLIEDHDIHRCWGLTTDVFDAVPGKDMLSKFTNPSILAYGEGSDQYGIQIVSKSNGVYTINVYTSLQSVIDNLPPFRPINFSDSWDASGTHPKIWWDANTEPDLQCYEVWKKKNGSWSLKATTTNTSYIDYSEDKYSSGHLKTHVYYKVRAKDTQNNVSSFTRTADFAVNGSINMNSYNGAIAKDEPITFQLEKNFPNPFNPSTKIEFSLAERSIVSLTVYDLRGRLIRTLVEGTKNKGHFTVTFDGSQLSSGVYIYQLKAQSLETNKQYVFVKQMLLIK